MTWPVTQVSLGDLITAAQLDALPVLLAEASGAAASFTFSSIPQYWSNLLLVCAVHDGSGNNKDTLQLKLNADGGANYSSQRVSGAGTSVSGDESVAANLGRIGYISGHATQGSFSGCAVWIPNYAESQKHSWVGVNFSSYGASVGRLDAGIWGGFYDVAAAITELKIQPSSGSFIAGSNAFLYGMGSI